jgi:hypothetical protein
MLIASPPLQGGKSVFDAKAEALWNANTPPPCQVSELPRLPLG